MTSREQVLGSPAPAYKVLILRDLRFPHGFPQKGLKNEADSWHSLHYSTPVFLLRWARLLLRYPSRPLKCDAGLGEHARGGKTGRAGIRARPLPQCPAGGTAGAATKRSDKGPAPKGPEASRGRGVCTRVRSSASEPSSNSLQSEYAGAIPEVPHRARDAG